MNQTNLLRECLPMLEDYLGVLISEFETAEGQFDDVRDLIKRVREELDEPDQL